MSRPHTKESFKALTSIDDNGCWNFNGPITNTGYGRVGYNGKVYSAHRLSYIMFVGPVENSKIFVCHKCDNPRCVNPDHLFLGTAKDNVHDMIKKGRAGKRGKITKVVTIEARQLVSGDVLISGAIVVRGPYRKFGSRRLTLTADHGMIYVDVKYGNDEKAKRRTLWKYSKVRIINRLVNKIGVIIND